MKLTLGKYLLAGMAAVAIISFSGCASSVTRDVTTGPTGYKLSSEKKASEVKIAISPAAKEKLKDNLKFDQEKLRTHVERALAAYSVLDASRKGELPLVEVLVTSMRVRSNFSAVAFGVMAGGDNISGDILIRDASGKVLDQFHVSATYALGGLAGGQDEARMGWLYEAFAKKVVEEITGTKKN